MGRISDYTGTVSTDGGRQITQGASLMAFSALAKSGARMVERYDTSVSELELRYANNRLIGEEGGADNPEAPPFRQILAGQVPGSDFYIVGGITEVNYNIRSAGFDIAGGEVDTDTGGSGIINGRVFVMNVALDLRMVQTTSMEIVDVISYQKQIVGREISAGVFDFLNGNVFDISAGQGGMEPVQLAVRTLVERAVLEMMANLYGARPGSLPERRQRSPGRLDRRPDRRLLPRLSEHGCEQCPDSRRPVSLARSPRRHCASRPLLRPQRRIPDWS